MRNNFNFFYSKQDGSLSDTAVALQGLDATARPRTKEQRSPKGDTPTRERERFGTGMGKKSNSTSQLSATGMLINFFYIKLMSKFI